MAMAVVVRLRIVCCKVGGGVWVLAFRVVVVAVEVAVSVVVVAATVVAATLTE